MLTLRSLSLSLFLYGICPLSAILLSYSLSMYIYVLFAHSSPSLFTLSLFLSALSLSLHSLSILGITSVNVLC